MNLFWETRALTSSREDHLTCFVAAALEVDERFRAAYASLVLDQLAEDGRAPVISAVETQIHFAEQRSVPDMVLGLDDGRRVLVEHKIDAPETKQVTGDGQAVKQLERYLAIPGVAGLAYFRSLPAPLAPEILEHERYLRPRTGAHFLWRDLYEPLESGSSDVARWMVAAFDRLGFTPPVPHVGELRPHSDPQVVQNQRNFAKLWQPTWAHFEARYKLEYGSRCELYLTPRSDGLVKAGYVSPLAQGGSLLRTRVDIEESDLGVAQRLIEEVAERLPVASAINVVQKPGERTYIDLMAPLRLLFKDADTVPQQERRLYDQVVPVFDALDDRSKESA